MKNFKNIAVAVATFAFAFGLSVQGGYFLQNTYEDSLHASLWYAPDANGFDIFRSRDMRYRKPGDPRVTGKEFEVTNSTVGHPMFKHIWSAYNAGRTGQSKFDEQGNWLGYKQGQMSTEELLDFSKNYNRYQSGQYRGSRYHTLQPGGESMSFFTSATDSLETQKENFNRTVLKHNKFASKRASNMTPGRLSEIRSLTPAEMSKRYREYLELKRSKYLENTPKVEDQTGMINYEK